MRNFQIVFGFLSLLALADTAVVQAREVIVTVVDEQGQALSRAVVSSPLAGPQPPAKNAVIDQVEQLFDPFISVVQVGATVNFPNSDNIRHQVFSFSAAKQFELPLYSNIEAPAVEFPNPGVVVLGCNIHDHMRAYLYVSPHPQSVLTDKSGQAQVTVTSGESEITVWYPGLGNDPATELTVSVAAQETQINVQLPVTKQQQQAPEPSALQQRFNQLKQHVH
ncbi:cupredoxin domain-containing protein [Pseudidiomarina salilacus]|uniref:methylamine utilization protein n=1 Tax=Pseudidiomarina salilacus TaxID=3384452 RepID=UPI0039852EE9